MDKREENRGFREPSGKKPGRSNGARFSKGLAMWVLLFFIAVLIVRSFGGGGGSDEVPVSYPKYRDLLEGGQITSAVIEQESNLSIFHGKLRSAQKFTISGTERRSDRIVVNLGPISPEDRKEWLRYGLSFKFKEKSVKWTGIILGWLPWLLFIGFWILIFRQMQGGPKGIFSFGKSKARLVSSDRPKVTFKDVAGADEAKEELQEIIEFLKDPSKFQRLGGKVPKGVLLVGPPGTGKTYMARAVAGEAGVPFFSISGSDFVEMFVGVGASRVRDLFLQGKANAPCIIFIDEIDAVGRYRGAGIGGGHDEREQTLNQLLVEMDGFESNEGVIVIAATNRPDVLDPALLRPGRFDRQVVIDLPDVKGREGILKVHTRNIPLAPDVDLEVLARGTPGLSGADLANLVNEAALLASKQRRDSVTMEDFENAKDKIMMGAERKSMVISDKEKKLLAYHEMGHALVAKLTPGSDPVHKVTIIPRGRALGVTHYLPMDERHTYPKSYLMTRLIHALGGRCAEKLVFNEVTTGSMDDYRKATELARSMVCEWGMSDKLGPVVYGEKDEQIFLGKELARRQTYSERTAQMIDQEILELIKEAEREAEKLLRENIDKLHTLAAALLEHEVLDGSQIDRILRGEKLEPKVPKEKRPAEEAQAEEPKTVPDVSEPVSKGVDATSC